MSFKAVKAECSDFSPTFNSHSSRAKTDKENNSSIPVLSLVQFSRAPFVSFGTIKLGSSKSLPLRIENPTEDATTTVRVDKISASKGFSIDQTYFTIQPEDSVILTVTWTPVEEGGVRELLTFVANGIVKHQAILLGKAEVTKKKKKTLWDSIKSKRGFPAPSKEKKVASMSIKAANKTFHVSRQSQYSKGRTSNPLSPLNQEMSANGGNVVVVNTPLSSPYISKPAFVTEAFDDLHLQKNSPVVVLVSADKLLGTPDKKDAPCSRKAECKEITRVLNKTLSPISTPERFRNALALRIQSPLPVIEKCTQDERQEPEKPSLSVKDALDVIGSNLSHAVSPPNACSSFDFSDSLEFEKLDPESVRETSFRATVDISPPVKAPHPRLTYCVKPNKAIGTESNHDQFWLKTLPLNTSTVTKLNKVDYAIEPEDLRPTKVPINSTTVTKSKAEVSESPALRKKKTSRRRLLEKTVELSEPSNAESNTSSPESISALPIIHSDSSSDVATESKTPVTLMQVTTEKPTLYLSPCSEHILSSISPIRSQPEVLPCFSQTPTTSLELAMDKVSDKVPSGLCLDQFPVHCKTLVPSKKRKSDEFLRDHSEDTSTFQAKKCRAQAHATEPKKASRKKTFTSKSTSGQQHRKPIAPPSSRKFTKPPPKTSCPNTIPNDGPSVKSLSNSTRKPAKIVAVAQAKLTFMKPTQTAIPRHPMPFAAKNMFYDERWIEKQETGFTWWMNYVLTPDDFKVATEVTKVNALSLTMGNEKFNIPKAPTKEEMSFRTYTARQRLNRLRRAACKLFTSDTMVKAIQRLELEVEAKRLLVRKDRHLWKDIGERQKVLNWLVSYNPLWLRIGLETIYGELISLESNSDVMGLAMFILGRLLWNPDIAAEFRHPKVPHLYRDGHEEALSRFTLKKLILLVCFLDKAKESRLIEHDPCLFCMDAEFKSSKDLLLAFSRNFLSGEGILSRHVSHLGLAVSHVQTPLDEFNFAVKNLAVDLRCGIRLVRVMELFTLDWTLSRKLRIPAISRLQKVHNVEVALQVLKSKGVDLKDEHGTTIDSRDIVDGHREKTLNLLWKIIFTFQVEVLLDENKLKEEISFLRKTWRTKQKLASLMANKCVVSRMKARQPFEHPSQKVTLLLDWVNAVCEFYDLKAENFTVSFSDGRILCYLIHHYHPGHLPAAEIQQRTTQTIECGHRGRVELNYSSSDSDSSFDILHTMQAESLSVDFRELLENERNNFHLVNSAVSFLGGVPAMINPEDMSNTIPNEKVVTCYLSFLCARLLDLRNDTRAARVIQGAWRRYKLQKDIELIQQKNLAASKIQALVRTFIVRKRLIRQKKAAVMIQVFWRGYAAREKLRVLKQERHFAIQNAAATVIQKKYKAWNIQTLLKKNHAASLIQVAFRKWHAKKVMERNTAALRIQSWYRMQCGKKHYLEMKSKAICIQAWFRGHCQKRKFETLKKRHHASVVIQSAYRSYLVRQQISKMKQSTVLIQRWFHACMLRKSEQKRYLELKSAVTTLQSAVRGWKVRRTVAQRQQAALLIQSAFKRLLAQRHFMSLKRSAIILQQRYKAKLLGVKIRQEYIALKLASVTIQAMWRGRAERRKIDQLHTCAKIIQSHYRRYVAQTQFLEMKQAAIAIQRQYRALKEGQKVYAEYTEIKRVAIVLQSAYRGKRLRQELQKKNKAATLIQSAVRAYSCRQRYFAQKSAAITIQRNYRAFALGQCQRDHFIHLRQATVTLQAIYRGSKVRRNLRREHQAATIIQAQFRMHKVRVAFLAAKCAAIVIQQQYRAYRIGKCTQATYMQMKNAAVVLQSAYRGKRSRQELQKKNKAATLIQSVLRAYSNRQRFLAQKRAAIVIQQSYRSFALGQCQRDHFIHLRQATVMLQAIYRGSKVRRNLRREHQAATIIQAQFRMHKVRVAFLAAKFAAIVIQQQYRAYRIGKCMQATYLRMKNATVVLQSAYRGKRLRQELQKKNKAATLIQSAVRAYSCRQRYFAQKSAAITIQRSYRAFALGQCQRDHFIHLRQATVTLQAIYRGSKVRRNLRREHQAATNIQAQFRMHKVRIAFLAAKFAAIVIQQRYRAYRIGKYVQATYLQMKNAAVVLQSAYRGMRVRQELQKKHKAATLIQSVLRAYSNRQRFLAQKRAATNIQAQFRMHKVRIAFLAAKFAAIVIQQRYRAYRIGKCMQATYSRMKNAAVVIQSAFRGMEVRNHLRKTHQAATVIQANFRGRSQLKKYRRQQWATLVLQQRFRAIATKNAAMKQYAAMKTSSLCIQSAFRGMMVRKQIAEKHKSAIIIQKTYRVYKQRRDFLSLRSATIRIQERYRAALSARQQRKRYCCLRAAAITLQSVYRGKKIRNEINKRHKAATVIQAQYQMYRTRVTFQAMRLAAMVIQRQYRCYLLRREARENFLQLRRSATVIQAVYRGNRTRRDIAKMHFAATVIQRKYLAYKERKCFLSIRAAVEFCQRRYRSILVAKQDRRDYVAKRHAIVVIQAAFKGMKVHQQVCKEREAATIIQSHVRKHILKVRFKRLWWAVKVVQLRFRANKIMRQEMAALKEKKNAAVVLQAAYRGMKFRQTLKQLHHSATVIQTTFRGCSARKRYLALKNAAIAIQQRYRARQQRKHFLEMRHGALLMQAWYRGYNVRRTLLLQHQAAVLIQSYFRKHKVMVKYQAMRLSAIIIQIHYRSYIQARADRENYLRLRRSIIVIQAAFRGLSARRRLEEMHKASIIIQAAFRMHQQRSAFNRQSWAARVLQQRFRALKLRDEQVQRYQQVRNAVICLQKSFRGMKGRECARRTKAVRTIQSYLRMSVQRQRFLKEKAAAIVIQSVYRGHRTRVSHAKMQESAVLIQNWYRSLKLILKERNGFVALRQATLTLQSALRGMLARRLAKRRRAAIKIQSVLCMHVHRKHYMTLRSSVVKLQAHYRMFAAQKRYHRWQAAAVTLQKHYRAHRATIEQRCRYLKKIQSIKILQARVRGSIEYRRFQRLRTSAIIIQAQYRGVIERRKFQQLKESVCVIQKHYRAFQICQRERAQFLQLRRSSVLIQTAFRAYQTRQHAVQTQAAWKIQAWFRGRQARQRYILKQAAIATIRRCIQTRHQRSRFQAIQHSVRIIQQRWRETLIARKLRADFMTYRKSVICIQALWRGSRVRYSIQKQIKAAVKIQSAFRGLTQRLHYKQQRASAIILQRHFRALQLARVEKENLRRRWNAAVYLQSLCRGWLTRKRIKETVCAARRHHFTAAVYHHLCAIKIQRAVRAHWALKSAKRQISLVLYIQQCFRAKLQRQRYLKDRQDIITVQRKVRTWLHCRNQAATTIQHAVKRFLLRCRMERLQQGIIKAQALWRGHCSRKLNDSSKVASIRQRFREVNRMVKEEDKLCNKTTTALSYLLGYQNYAYILAALKHLETATRLSPECCERLVESGATHTVFTLIRSCNRSVPSMEIITLSIQILLNLSKYNRTIDAVYDVNGSVETLLDLLQIYREKAGDKVADKGGSIFTKACFLLVLLVQDERRAMEVRKQPKTSDRIRSIYRLTLRKCKMDAERSRVKQKMNATLNGSFLQATPRKSKPMARFAPDWVLRRDKMKDIVDPLRAIQMLANALALVP
ncbi:abnormal spindle-like microcephaly-associated protein homolog isoform X3 [Myxocyprinus asiaticus]|uniref:abnormal spindle-like microcephaly-associated protein homolog isoform X3 n=1 Tax=Myxocyprinus asiaticus TaxID=70543 RepID=UPI0022223BC6|nr:abnormal spindle-like microcephaly-associated protein homolog isoform X3 [Myxocyprinus asiaticus]